MTGAPLKYLIDTGWVIRHLRGRKEYSARLTALEPDGLAISVITLAELQEGVERSNDPVGALIALQAFLASVRVLPVEDATARVFGAISAKMRAAGHHPGDFDVMIASTATQHGLTVLTTDVDDFSRFTGLFIITTP